MKSEQNARTRALAKVAEAQAGAFALGQAREAGFSAMSCQTQIAHGRWARVTRGVYRVAGAPSSWEQRVWAACLESGGYASHRTAAWIHGLDGVGRSPPGELELVVAYDERGNAHDARVRRSRTLVDAHLSKKNGIPMTNVARTLIDLSEVLAAKDLELAFDSALRRHSDLRHWVSRLLRTMPSKGHRGIAKLRALLDEKDIAVDSALEVKLRRLLKSAGVRQPQAGVDVVEAGLHIAKLDFAWPHNRPRVALQAHGVRWHANTRRWRNDLAQATQLSGLGWRVLQCSLEDVERRPALLLRDIRRALAGFEAPVDADVHAVISH